MSLNRFLQASSVDSAFREATLEFARGGRPGDRIAFDSHSPPVKVQRALTKLLETCPELPIERVEIRGTSGCEFYRGNIAVHAAGTTRRFRFYWDCKWKAEQQGWTDYFGFPDQIRAAREFGYDCFREWDEVVEAEPATAG